MNSVVGAQWRCTLNGSGSKKTCLITCDDPSITPPNNKASCNMGGRNQNKWKVTKNPDTIKCEKICDPATLPAIADGSWDVPNPITWQSPTWTNYIYPKCDNDEIIPSDGIRCSAKNNAWSVSKKLAREDWKNTLCKEKCTLMEALQDRVFESYIL